MRRILLIVCSIILSSCWTVYQPVDANGKPQTIIRETITRNCNIHVSVSKKFRDTPWDYNVYVSIRKAAKETHLILSNIKVTVKDKSKHPVVYDLVKIKVSRITITPGHAVQWQPIAEPSLTDKTIDLWGSESYFLLYSFNGENGKHRSRNLWVSLDGTINGETVRLTTDFKKGKEVQILH